MIQSFKNYLSETRMEMGKVSWPTRSMTVRFTILVVVISIAVALYLAALDFGFARILQKFIFN